MLRSNSFPTPASHVRRMLLALAAIGLAVVVQAPGAAAAPSIVVDVRSGKVLSQEQAFDRWYPASLTKLMTVYTVFREIESGRVSLTSPVRISQKALAEPPSKMGFPAGTILNVDNAIKIVMVKSANDISTALAESVAGSEAAFVAKMNEHARRLGMTDSRFTNAHGLHDTGQYTTARDMAVLAIAIRREFPRYGDYFDIPAIRVGKQRLSNHNPLLARFDGTTGMKTGFLCASGLNIVVSAKRGLRELIAVVLGGPTGQERNVRAARLLSEGFAANPFFVAAKVDTMKPAGAANRQAPDLRATVCQRKKPAARKNEDSATTAAFAMQAPSLDELEEKYLKPPRPVARIETVALGNATGPDPFGLVGAPQSSSASAFAAEESTAPPTLATIGGRQVRIPVPTPRPVR
ncbi:MAG: D-alanyl-D-alanine carboxypeptidase [Alphaproteobacteria bacterium]|nr:MAG: D-alanyl-D-alanine carboxypeptidase [Alphaproteobacteria bacterium]